MQRYELNKKNKNTTEFQLPNWTSVSHIVLDTKISFWSCWF